MNFCHCILMCKSLNIIDNYIEWKYLINYRQTFSFACVDISLYFIDMIYIEFKLSLWNKVPAAAVTFDLFEIQQNTKHKCTYMKPMHAVALCALGQVSFKEEWCSPLSPWISVVLGLISPGGMSPWGVQYDDVMTWKHVPHHWPFVRGIHWSLVDSPHKGPVMGNFDVFFDVALNKLLNKQLNCQWFEIPWHHFSEYGQASHHGRFKWHRAPIWDVDPTKFESSQLGTV